MNYEFILDNIKRFNYRVKVYGNSRYIYFWFSFIYCAILFGSSFDDYFRYQFYRKSNFERRKFITYKKSQKLIKDYNNPDMIDKVLDKRLFNKTFKDYISREWIDINNSTYDEFCEFIQKHNTVIIKPINNHSGRGIWKYAYKENDDLLELYKTIKNTIVEEIITQHHLMNNINPSTVNTIRVSTFMVEGKINIIACTLRCGNGDNIVDNYHSGGLIASIDIDTGTVVTPGINNKLESFYLHSYSNEKIIGRVIPKWNELKQLAIEVALKIPELKYLGWDFVILEDGFELLEANHDQGHDVIQVADQIGKYELIKKILNKKL